MKKHYKSFFGKKCAVIISSDYEERNFYLNFIQEKENNQWEKYQEGLSISLNLKEICEIAEILKNDSGWTKIIHKYEGELKDFWLGFEKKREDTVFSIKGQVKKLNSKDFYRSHQKSFFKGDLRLLKKLWFHLEDEFIEFTTNIKKDKSSG